MAQSVSKMASMPLRPPIWHLCLSQRLTPCCARLSANTGAKALRDIGDFKKLTWRGNVAAAMRQVATPCAEAIADHVAKLLAD
jgi:hypothetical protein